MLVITSGDPHSVTVELAAPLLGVPKYRQSGLAVVGSAWQWRDQASRLGFALPDFRAVRSLGEVRPGDIAFLEVGIAADQRPAESLSPKARGDLSRRALAPLSGATQGPLAVVTGPIDKYACREAGYAFPGQTEYFEDLWRSRAVMTLAGPRLRVGLVTNHLPLKDVAAALTTELVESKLRLFVETLRRGFGIARPRVAVCGLNPHAGDHGLFGKEDGAIVAPAVARVAESAVNAEVVGPKPADTVFYRAYQGDYDGVLALYHDQGLGPLKTVHFDDAVNLSGGLPHFRASPDHGPARDLFLKRQASPRSFAAALDLASRYLEVAER